MLARMHNKLLQDSAYLVITEHPIEEKDDNIALTVRVYSRKFCSSSLQQRHKTSAAGHVQGVDI